MRWIWLLAFLVAGTWIGWSPAAVSAAQKDEKMTAEISTGDNQWMLWLPMDSQAAIESAFEVLSRDFHVNRIWWRGGQDELWLRNFTFRPANRFYDELWGWVRHLVDEVGTNRIAIAAARKNKMQIWMETGLFEFASHADAGGCNVYPYQCESNLRLEHPQWLPVNKYGTRTQNGPIEFAYPEARKAVIDQLAGFLVDQKYDGVVFYTYVENFSYRYLDEFGYNEPIVREFKKRYGVDIRTQPFDKEAWARLRGEYVTQFLRELRAVLKPHGIKVAVRLNPRDGQSHMPEIWAASNKGPISTAGHIEMDWETWIKQGIVDELCLYWPGNELTAKAVLAATKGTQVRVSMYQSRGEMLPGLSRCLFPGEELTSGFPRENFIGWDDQKIDPQPLESLRSKDKFARRRIMYLIAHNKQPDAASAFDQVVAAATNDPDLYVRRLAVDALAAMKDPRAIPVLESALNDKENSVRCKAAMALGEMRAARSIDLIFQAVDRHGTLQFVEVAALNAISKLAAIDPKPVLRRVTDPNVVVRRLAVRCLGNSSDPATQPTLLRAATEDKDMYVRELALKALSDYPCESQTVVALEQAMKQGDETLQVRAATDLARQVSHGATTETPESGSSDPTPFKLLATDSEQGRLQRQALELLVGLFHQYGDGCTRGDADWGWRPVGNAILCFGDQGEAELKKLIADPVNRKLAENAWNVVYIRQSPSHYCLVDEKQDEEAHRHHPFLNKQEIGNKPKEE
ncbi:MAG: HEAT repeat domain-containing protein [Phycisphaerales bacterium]|jgi:hypothetical protein|nr:HEAT repeat domain-containing protein [Phycisphaerales bacterium]